MQLFPVALTIQSPDNCVEYSSCLVFLVHCFWGMFCLAILMKTFECLLYADAGVCQAWTSSHLYHWCNFSCNSNSMEKAFTLPELKDSFLEIILRKDVCFQNHKLPLTLGIQLLAVSLGMLPSEV